jgi:bifunctional DNA-binding transcriptional regulator/antitoxin component of YhaV-PrlF toxin-antitoxin module
MAYREEYQSLGLRASVNPDGSITIPSAMLEGAGIAPASIVEVFADSQFIYIRTAEDHCEVCNENANTTKVGNLKMCKSCIDELNNQAKTATEGSV